MPDLRALLGDKYVATVRAAGDAVRSELIRGDLAKIRATEHDVASAALAAVLPGLLADARREGQADAWDEGRKLGLRQADWEYGVTPDPMPELANPYRTERTDHA